MKHSANKLLSLFLVLVMLVGLMAVPALAEGAVPFTYDGDAVNFIKENGAGFGMFEPQDGTSAYIVGDDVVIHYVPKNKTVYNGLHWGAINDATLTKDVTFNAGTFDITLSKNNCGKALPVAPIKADDATKTTSTQYYLAIPAADKLLAIPDGTYALPDLKAGPSEMFNHFIADSKQLVVNGENATIRFITDGSTTSVQKYSKIALGKSSELLTTNYQAEIASGTTIIEGVLQSKTNDTDPDQYLFEVTLPTADVSALLANTIDADIFITVWNNKGASSNGNVPGWYKASNDLYLSLGALGDAVTTPGTPGPPTPGGGSGSGGSGAVGTLEITNTTGMFKAVTASFADGKLTFALSSTGYKNIFKGTYEQAVANGDKRENWIAGTTNADGKLEFVVPVADGETVIPLVAISQSYLEKADKGENSLARAFYPRQMTLDRETKTLVTGDYESNQALTVTNNVKMFKVSTASLETLGGPNSNNYKSNLVLTMGSESFDKAFVGRAADVTDSSKTVALSESKTFDLPVKWVETFGQPETMKSLLGGAFVVSFHSVSKDAWYERQFTVSESAATLIIDEVTTTPENPGGGGGTQPVTDSIALTLDNKVPQFLVTSATLNTTGTAGTAGYTAELVLAMSNATYDKAYIGSKEDAASASATIALAGGAFTLPVTDAGTAPFAVSFHSKDSDNWYEHQFTLSGTTLRIEDAGSSGSGKGDSSELPYSGDAVTFVKKDGTSSFGMFAPQTGTTAALSGDNVVIHYVPKNTTVYNGLHWGAIDDAELTKDVTFNADGTFDITLAKDKCGKLLPVAPIKAKDGGTTGEQYYLAIPAADKLQGADSGSGSGSGSGSKDASAVDKKTETNPDGSTTETVRYDDGSVVATTTKKDGSTDKVTTRADGSVGEVKTDASGSVTEASATVSASALTAAAGKPVTLPVLLPAAKDSASAAPLTVTLPAGTNSAAVEIPVTDAGDDSVVVLVHADGTEEILPRTGKTANGLTVRLDGNSTVKIINNAQSFTDLPKNAEEARAIRFVAARGIMNGVGDGAFAPDAPMTRGMIATVLYRMERKPAVTGGTVFADVSAGQWYSDAIAWASASGIVQGYGESFGVNDALTKEQLIVMLWRLAGKPAATAVESDAHDWAAEAVSWAVSVGLIDRDSVGADISAPAARGQVAVLIERFINLG